MPETMLDLLIYFPGLCGGDCVCTKVENIILTEKVVHANSLRRNLNLST